MMVHVDLIRDCEQRVQLSLDLADRFDAPLIGVAGLPLRPAFAAGGIEVYEEPTQDVVRQAQARFEDMSRKFRAQGQCLKHAEWREAFDLPSEVLLRESRAADLLIVGTSRGEGRSAPTVDPGVIVLRAGRPVLVVPDIVTPAAFQRVLVAWKDTRECRRALRDSVPFLKRAKEVLVATFGEEAARAQGKTMLADVGRYLARHEVVVSEEVFHRSRGPVGEELLQMARDENADLIVAGGYGHSRLGEWVFGGVTRDLLARSSVCCLLSH